MEVWRQTKGVSEVSRSRVAVVVLCTAVLLVCAAVALGQIDGWLKDEERGPTRLPRTTAEIEIIAVGGKGVIGDEPIVLELVDAAGVDVELSVWAAPQGASIWVLENARGTSEWVPYGPAKETEGGAWRVYGVASEERLSQARYATLRAVVMKPSLGSEGLDRGGIRQSDWEEMAVAISPPMRIEVLRRVTTRDDSARTQVEMLVIGGVPVRQTEPTVVAPSATVEGNSEGITAGMDVRLILHPVGTEQWRLLEGAALVSGKTWRMPDVAFSVAGEPQWLHVDLVAVVTAEPRPAGLVDRSFWQSSVVAASRSARLFVQSKPPLTDSGRVPMLSITRIGRRGVGPRGSGRGVAAAEGDSVAGTALNMPEGSRIWVLVRGVGSEWWLGPPGPAVVRGSEWELPSVRLRSTDDELSDALELVAVVSGSTIPPGRFDYAFWRERAEAVSAPVRVRAPDLGRSRKPSVEITTVGGRHVGPERWVWVDRAADVEGELLGRRQSGQVYVATRESDDREWSILGPALVHESTWLIPDARLGGRGQKDTEHVDLIAFLADTTLPKQRGSLEYWRHYATVVSDLVRVYDDPSADGMPHAVIRQGMLGGLGTIAAWGLLSLALLAALVLLAVLLQRTTGLASRMCEAAAGGLESVERSVLENFTPQPRINPARSVLGLGLFAAAFFAIRGYFPIYTRVLREVLQQPALESRSLATLLIVFTALAGVLIDVVLRYRPRELVEEDDEASDEDGTDDEDGEDNEDKGSGEQPLAGRESLARWAILGPLVGATMFLWWFQALVYYQYYYGHIQDPADLAPRCGMLAAAFVGVIETFTFWWATRLSLPFISWMFMHVLFYWPLGTGITVLRCLGLALDSLPKAVPAPGTGQPVAADAGGN